MNLLKQLALGHAVDGEHIDIETAHIVDMHALYQRGGIVLYLAKGEGVVFVVLGTDGLQAFGQPLLGVLHEALVVGARHADVDVVVPGNETAMTDGAQHGAVADVATDIVFAAHTIDIQENGDDVLL